MKRNKMNETFKALGLFLAVAVVACGLVLPQPVSAALPAPNWLPGQPMMAGGQIIAMWLPVPGAVKYVIYLDGKKLTESPANQYMGPAPAEGGEHVYEVAAFDSSGAESPRSQPGKILIKILQAPKKPIFRVNADEKSVLLRWTRPEGATIFNVYKGESKDGPFTMLTSTQEEVYKDTGLDIGKSYFYAVSAKDMLGKESAQSEPVEIKLEESAVSKVAEAFTLTIVPTRSTKVVRGFSIDDIPVDMPVPTTIKRSQDGLYYILSRTNKIHVLDDQLNLYKVITVAPPEGIKTLDLYNLTFIDDETALVTDLNNSVVFIIDLAGETITQTIKIIKPTKEQNPEVYESMGDRFRSRPGQPLSVALLDDDTIWVADGAGGIVHHMTLDGEVLDWFSTYVDPDSASKEMRLANLPEMITLDDGSILVSTGVARTVLKLNPENREVVYKIGEAASMVGKFIGFGGMSISPNGTTVLVSDPTMHTIQGFDLTTGLYSFSIGGPENKADPAQETRPMIDFSSPFFAMITGNNEMLFFNKMENAFDQRTILEPLPVSKAGE